MQRARVTRLILAGSIAVMSLPITAAAQPARTQRRTLEPARALQVTPYLGTVQSLGSLVADSMVRLRPVGAPVLGTRIAFQPAAVWGFEASLGWSPNLIAQSDWKRTVDPTGGVWPVCETVFRSMLAASSMRLCSRSHPDSGWFTFTAAPGRA